MRTILKVGVFILLLGKALAEEEEITNIAWSTLFFSPVLKEQNKPTTTASSNLSYEGFVFSQVKKATYWINGQMYHTLPKGLFLNKQRLAFKEGDKYIQLLVGETYGAAGKRASLLVEEKE